MKNSPFPKMVTGLEWPENGSTDFIIRLRNPFVITQPEEMESGEIHFNAWPDIRSITTDKKLLRIMKQIADFDTRWIKAEDAITNIWAYSFGKLKSLPKHIFIDSPNTDWEGVLRLVDPISIWAFCDDTPTETQIQFVSLIDPIAGRLPFTPSDSVILDVNNYYREYTTRILKSMKEGEGLGEIDL